jgi:putative ABC transport system substrate-binding protein
VPSILIAVTLLAVAVIAEAQQPEKVARIGVLVPGSVSSFSSRIEAFLQMLRGLGYSEGKSIFIEYRYAEGKRDDGRILLRDRPSKT